METHWFVGLFLIIYLDNEVVDVRCRYVHSCLQEPGFEETRLLSLKATRGFQGLHIWNQGIWFSQSNSWLSPTDDALLSVVCPVFLFPVLFIHPSTSVVIERHWSPRESQDQIEENITKQKSKFPLLVLDLTDAQRNHQTKSLFTRNFTEIYNKWKLPKSGDISRYTVLSAA